MSELNLPWRIAGINILDDVDTVIAHVFDEDNANLIVSTPELLEALENLQKELHANIKMNVKKHFGLMVADAQANKAIYKAKGGKL